MARRRDSEQQGRVTAIARRLEGRPQPQDCPDQRTSHPYAPRESAGGRQDLAGTSVAIIGEVPAPAYIAPRRSTLCATGAFVLVVSPCVYLRVRFPVPAGNMHLTVGMDRALPPPICRIASDLVVRSGPRVDTTATPTRFPLQRSGWTAADEQWGSKLASKFYGCSNSSSKFLDSGVITHADRYLMIVTSGGLNQQRTGIIDAVVAARILNATLVVPKLDQTSFWKDASDFAEIFDADWFISSLSKDVRIVKVLPDIGGKLRAPHRMRVPRKCTQRCYLNRVLPALLKKHVVRLTKFDYRLANRLDSDLQKLRCRVNYHALRFTDPIQEMGEKIIQRMRERSTHFIALHLRFEPDMLAFSGCYYGGGEKEKRELGAIRKRWKTLHASNPEKERRHGRCPLTPEEVGLMLKALGYASDVHIYVASGDIYGGARTLEPLKALFPNLHTKETIASKDELAPFSKYSSRMAALDFIVCDGSDAFVTNNNGNMAKILAGRRRYLGHKRTIRPNAKRLYSLFLTRGNMSWDAFSSKVHMFQKGFMGEPKELRPGRGEFHENPSTCICEKTDPKTLTKSNLRSEQGVSNGTEGGKATSEPTVPNYTDEELRGSGVEEDDTPVEKEDDTPVEKEDDTPLEKEEIVDTEADDDALVRPDDPELEEVLSD